MSERYEVQRTSSSNSGLRYYILDTQTNEPAREETIAQYVLRFKTAQDAQVSADQLNDLESQ